MAFINKFKNKKAEDQVPEGVKVEYSSFGQPQSSYNPNLVQQNMNSNQSSSQNGNHNSSSSNNKQQTSSLAQTSVWNDDQPAKLNNTAAKQVKGKPNFMQKNIPQQPAPVQQPVESTQSQKPATNTPAPAQRQEINLKIENQPVAKKIKFEIKNEFDLLDDNDLNFPELEFQKKLVNDIVAPGGIRIKQQEDVLNTFADDCQAFYPCVIGSLLINKFFSNEQNVVKQRAIYASEILVKKHQKFQEYFKRQQFMVQKSQQFNIGDSKFVQLSNQLLAVVSNPSLEIKEQADINFNFSQGNDLSKFSKKNEQQQPQLGSQVIQKNNQQQASNVNLIDEIDVSNGIDLLGDQSVSASQSKPKSLFNNLNKKKTNENQAPVQQNQTQNSQIQQPQQQSQPSQNTNGESKIKQFMKFKGKQNNENNQNNLNKDGDLLNLIDEQTNNNGKTNTANNHQGLQDQFSLLNLYTHENKESQNYNQNYNNFQYQNSNNNNSATQFNQFNPPHIQQTGLYQPQFPQPGFNGQHVPGYPYQNNGYPQYPQQGYQPYGQQMQPNIYGYNNPGTQNAQAFKTIHMDFSGQNNHLQEKQILDLNNFKIDENTPNQKNSQQQAQKSRQQINEGAFDFISL
ncbi:tetratricopeptide repeat protein (macronuclear) [Tetrahymena thermophila SB210]|uniref:Tetratricopeptide repeat protein n=1 Tax=Tetrahymena thermophila (strain SB210) TaxID=312017 RepID=I7LU81_TETTS|nr:tetratricopeptide repeat protein [Tetrahymena thermophila SB210]EAR90778.2 tetratricopeptide repeat protein [Tetrahymena thermophila SB210]|eukprot:XP_001011023.2 tetratricopeptide repeat protein [Tetrahymena thermophila SB210]